MKKGCFIALEGIDGCGKSTQARLLAEKCTATGMKVYLTCEPTNSPIGKMIRDIFSHRMDADHRVIAGLFVADRLDHLLNKTNGLLKKLEEGYTVITDRYYLSSYAYQSIHADLDWVIAANALSAQLLKPDLNVYIDITAEQAMERLNKSREAIELYETFDNLNKVRNRYFEVMELLKEEEKVLKVPGNQPPENIAAEIWNAILKFV